jgi:hypothetical protein
VITLQDLYTFDVASVTSTNHIVGSLKASGLRAGFLDKFERRGVEVPSSMSKGSPPSLHSAGVGRG